MLSLVRKVVCTAVTVTLLTLSAISPADINLPTIGDASSGIVSAQKEREIGQVFLKMLHGRVYTTSDPQLVSYVENLVFKLAEASQLEDRNLSIVLVDSPQLNAFAAPGGIIGINTGLFLYAQSEEEFASVIAHELAHLSQRHYARGLEARKRRALPTLAALLGSIALAAAGAGDLGAAAISSTVAGAQSSQLAFTRENEKEADRVGLLTLARANYDPRGMAEMFERMSKTEGSGASYEFLRTHPLSRNRVADARSRAEQYRPLPRKPDFTYQIMRNRAILLMAKSPEKARLRFRDELKSGRVHSPAATSYILAQAELDHEKPKAAAKYLKLPLKNHADNLNLKILNNQILFASGKQEKAINQMRRLLNDNPGNYPITMALADLLYQAREFDDAIFLLKQESRSRPNDPYVWFVLAETAGLGKDIATVHTARAEYFFLVGDLNEAIQHLQYARELPSLPFTQKAALGEKIREIQAYKSKMKL